MPRLDADISFTFQRLGVKKAYVQFRQEFQAEGYGIGEAIKLATDKVCALNNIDLEKVKGPEGESIRRVKKRVRVTKATFEGRTASIADSIEWAASSVCLVDVSPKDAPSALGWSLLEFARGSPVGRIELMKSVSRLVRPVAGTGEDEKPFHFDPSKPAKIPDYLMTDEQLAAS